MAVIQKREAMDDDKRTKCGPAFGRRKHEITANYPILPRNTPSNRPDVPPARRVPNTQYIFLRGRKRGVLNQRDYLVWDIVWPAALQATLRLGREKRGKSVIIVIGSRGAEEQRKKLARFFFSRRQIVPRYRASLSIITPVVCYARYPSSSDLYLPSSSQSLSFGTRDTV